MGGAVGEYCIYRMPPAPVANSKHWFTTSFLQPLPYIQGWTRLMFIIVQELCESRGGRPGLSVLTSRLVSVDVKIY